MHFISFGLLAVVLALVAIPGGQALAQPAAEERWAEDMRRFAEADRKTPPQPGGVVFVGSSSIRLWDLAASFPDIKPLNRGFGGSTFADVTRHLDLLVLRHRPRLVVIYSGDNDIASGRTAREVADEFGRISEAIARTLPTCRVVCIGIKPSRQRWEKYPEMAEANQLIAEYCRQHPRRTLVDMADAMLGEDGLPKTDLFEEDGLHLNRRGYELWSQRLAPHFTEK